MKRFRLGGKENLVILTVADFDNVFGTQPVGTSSRARR